MGNTQSAPTDLLRARWYREGHLMSRNSCRPAMVGVSSFLPLSLTSFPWNEPGVFAGTPGTTLLP